MKFRIIIKNRRYVPQAKKHWYSYWRGLCRGYIMSVLGSYLEFDTIKDAVKEITEYKNQIKDNGKIVWKGL